MDLMMPVVALVATLLFVWVGRAMRAFPMAANFEGKSIPVAGTAVALGSLVALPIGAWRSLGVPWTTWSAAPIAIAAFGVLGYIDDRWGNRSVSGFAGHIRAASRGQITTGFIKLLGGGLTAVLCAFLLRDMGWQAGGPLWLLKAAVIALSANAVNLLDTRPVRAALGFLLLSVGSLLYDPTWRPAILAGCGGALAWLPLDRGRKAMLGDAGSNVLGALWSVTFVAYARWEAVVAALVLLVAFHIYAERRSLNADIAAVPLLRKWDEWIRG